MTITTTAHKGCSLLVKPQLALARDDQREHEAIDEVRPEVVLPHAIQQREAYLHENTHET